VVIFNDGITHPSTLFDALIRPFDIIDVKGSIAEVRILALGMLKETEAKNIIFQDADDLMSDNRISCCENYLEHYNIVVNDLDICDEQGIITNLSFWTKRIENGFTFDFSFIRDANIVGFGNTSIRRSLLHNEIMMNGAQPLAADWFVFYQIMEKTRVRGIFTNLCKVIYRQHDSNTAGFSDFNIERLQKVIKVKEAHFQGLEAIGYDFKKELAKLRSIDAGKVSTAINNVKRPLFWWEETKLIHEEN
jgi:hypothetical protein